MPAALDALVIGLYVELDDFLGPRHQGAGRPPKFGDAELITLAVAQVLLAMPNDGSSSRSRAGGWRICFRC